MSTKDGGTRPLLCKWCGAKLNPLRAAWVDGMSFGQVCVTKMLAARTAPTTRPEDEK